MNNQRTKEWDSLITKTYLEAYLLRESGDMSHLICRYMFVRRLKHTYISGQKRCTHCSVTLKVFDNLCPCCGRNLRIKYHQKAHSRLEELVRSTHEI